MRRIFQNTTAIAACLSLMAPHMAAAQAAAENDAVVLPPASEIAAPDAAAPAEAAPADMPVEEPAEVEPAEPAEVEQAEPAEPETGSQPAEAPPAQPEEVAPAPQEAAELPEGEPAATEADDEAEAATEVDADADAAPSPEAPAAEGSPAAAPAAEADAGVSAETEAEAEATAPAPAAPAAPAPEMAQPAEAPEADTAPDEAAAPTGGTVDAGQDGAAVSAAALDDAASAEVTEEQVTEENSRSSSEEFETTVDAASTAGAAQASTGGGDGGSDIARALLLGLGGLAVGTMLSNNRQVALATPDRIVVTRPDGTRQLIRDDVVLLRQPGSTVTTENFDDGSSRTVVTRADGSRVVTIRDADLRVLRRTLVSADGTQTILLDDTATAEAVDLASLPAPTQQTNASAAELDEAQLRDVLMGQTALDRPFSLAQIRDVEQLRLLAPAVDVETVNFATGSAAIAPDQAESLSVLGNVIRETIASNPREMFLIEGHTDTVGDPAANLALSDRRAESVALALVEYFQVPPENMVVQGYGEEFPKIQQEGDVPENRRAAVRRITDLLVTAEN